MSDTFLLEIGCEDLPARYVEPLSRALAQGVLAGIERAGFTHGELRCFATPRRLAVSIADMPGEAPEQIIERRGPALSAALKDGEPTPAGLGFARSCNIAFEDLERLETPQGAWVVHRARRPGQSLAVLLDGILEETLRGMDSLVPKRMRWGDRDDTFVRPVQWLVALLGGEILPLERFGLRAGRESRGHRFHAPEAIALADAADYEARLLAAQVWADSESRRRRIREQVIESGEAAGGEAEIPEDLLDEVAALVEWPVAITGRIEPRFLALPPEVVVATIRNNQRYFPLRDAEGALLPGFITVAGLESQDVAQVIAGNERVVRPRLTDALFFWNQDRAKPLADYLPALGQLGFHHGLGSMRDKVERIVELSLHMASAQRLPATDVERAARLCKADLVTRMVFEFPELQGLMGSYYALASDENALVAAAIGEHYQPVGAGAPIPATPAGRLVALADKLDSLAGLFAAGQRPSATKDPYALRRAALGVLRILIEAGIDLDLAALCERALGAQPLQAPAGTQAALVDFIFERLRGYYSERGLRAELIEAVRVIQVTNPLDFHRRLDALAGFLSGPRAQRLAAADKRIRNLLKQATVEATPSEAALCEPAELALHAELGRIDGELASLRLRADYAAMLVALSALQEPVDAFFDSVMVMVPDPALRQARLQLLQRLDQLCREVADLSCLPG